MGGCVAQGGGGGGGKRRVSRRRRSGGHTYCFWSLRLWIIVWEKA